jgi:serine/threonine protein kinase
MGGVVSIAADACESLTSFVLPNGQHPSQVTIKQASYRIDVLIGEGGYSFVYKATDRVGRSTVALKRFAIQDADEQTRLLEEVSVHRSLCPHENIVALIEHDVVSLKGKPLPEIWIAMEFAGPSMQTLVNARLAAGKAVERSTVLQFLGDTISALCHMHAQSPPIAHWDVKLDNILQGDAYKLCDFGSASKVFYLCQNSQEISVAEGELSQRMTLLYRAPETLDLWRKQRVDTKADLWSLGVALYTSLMQTMPFEENPLDILIGVPRVFRDKGPESWAVGNKCNLLPAESQDLMALVMDHMLVPDPSKRSDVFTVAEAFRLISQSYQVPARPRPGFVSAQKNRFSQ